MNNQQGEEPLPARTAAVTTKASAAIPDEAPASPIVRFLAADHRYVFLSTSVVAGIGMWLSSQVRSPWSFWRHFIRLSASYTMCSSLFGTGIVCVAQ